MNKNKKLVSFVCAIAMIITMLSSFTFVSAAEEGFTLSTPVVSSDGKTITFDRVDLRLICQKKLLLLQLIRLHKQVD